MKTSTKRMVETALLIAVATVLSMLKIDMPMGGGLTICSMLPIILLSHRYGWKWGLVSSTVYSLLQLVLGLDNVSYATSAIMAIGIIFLDYIIAYIVIGLSGLTEKFLGKTRTAVIVGIVITFTLRYLCHVVTGAWIWDVLWPNEYGMSSIVYSLAYNGWYMAAEIIITVVVAVIIYKPLEKYFKGKVY